MYIKKLFALSVLLAATLVANAQEADEKKLYLDVSAGPEFLYSLNHHETFLGYGATAQAHIWVRTPLALGIKTGVLHFSGADTFTGVTRDVSYTAIPVLSVIRYPMPFITGLYGQDVLGFTFTQNAVMEGTGLPVPPSFTYYFSLGYVLKDRLDISVKIGRSRFDRGNDVANVNEQNIGLRVAYVF